METLLASKESGLSADASSVVTPGTVPPEMLSALDRGAGIWVSRLRQYLEAPEAPFPLRPPPQRADALVTFWVQRAGQFQALHDEMTSEQAVKVLNLLTAAGLPRNVVLRRLQVQLESVTIETACLAQHTAGLKAWLDRLSSCWTGSSSPEEKTQKLIAAFKPMLTALRACWRTCEAIRSSPQNMLHLLRAISDDITEIVRLICGAGASLLTMESVEAAQCLRLCVYALGCWKSSYLEMTGECMYVVQ